MQNILIATTNSGKIQELISIMQTIKSFASLKILSLMDLKHSILPPIEDGASFEENAKLKAMYYFKCTNIPCIADDSGLTIPSLPNILGVKSADFAKHFISQKVANQAVINAVHNTGLDPAAYFTSSLVFYSHNKTLTANGTIHGKIAQTAKGISGFGYDPIFIPTNHRCTLAQMSSEQKNNISHRRIALNNLLIQLA